MALSDVLFSKTQQQVLGLLYGRPDQDFYTNEIIRLSGCGNGAVQRELAKLTKAGLIQSREMGNQKRYQANHTMPFYHDLRNIIIKSFGLTDILKNALKPLAKKIELAFIYGSIAKGKDTAASDIDVMIVCNEISYGDFYKVFSKVENKIGRKINPTIYSRNEWIKKKDSDHHFVARVLNQPRIFLLGEENE